MKICVYSQTVKHLLNSLTVKIVTLAIRQWAAYLPINKTFKLLNTYFVTVKIVALARRQRALNQIFKT